MNLDCNMTLWTGWSYYWSEGYTDLSTTDAQTVGKNMENKTWLHVIQPGKIQKYSAKQKVVYLYTLLASDSLKSMAQKVYTVSRTQNHDMHHYYSDVVLMPQSGIFQINPWKV